MAVTAKIAPADKAAALDARYGRTPRRKRVDRILLIILGAFIALVFLAWLVWTAFDRPGGNLDAQDVAHLVIDESTVSITWQVSVQEGTAVSCALQAQNKAHAIVGWKIVDLPPSTNFVNRYKETIRTSQGAVTGLIYRCWLT